MKIFKPKEPTAKEKEIARLFEELSTTSPEDPEYTQTLKLIAKLQKIGVTKKDTSMNQKDWVTILVPAGLGLLQVYMIIRHEDVNVISSKAFGLISKPKV